MRVGVLGGTFDPVHLAHLIIGEEARIQLELERVLFMPAGQPWLKAGQALSPGADRLRMVELAVEGNPHFQVCCHEVNRDGPTYTVDTLEELHQELGADCEIFFIIGQDALEQFHRWKEPARLLQLCRLVVAPRPGHDDFDRKAWQRLFSDADEPAFLAAPSIDISGTEIRRRAAAGGTLRYLVPDAVADYIKRRRLYQAALLEPEES